MPTEQKRLRIKYQIGDKIRTIRTIYVAGLFKISKGTRGKILGNEEELNANQDRRQVS